MRYKWLMVLTCAKLCAALGYESQDERKPDCVCEEHVDPSKTIVNFSLQMLKPLKKPEEPKDERPEVKYSDD